MTEEALAVVNLWLSALVMSHGLREVAKAYLVLAPAEAQVMVLRSRLAECVVRDGAELGAVIQADFARPDTVAVNGWIVSRTEARLAALRYLAG